MFWYGWARFKMIRKHPHHFKPIHLAPPTLVLFFCVFTVLSLIYPITKQVLFAGGMVYAAPLIYSCIKLAKNANEGIRMFAGYLVVHFSYGLGLLWGILI
jgi:hypothetical protein